MLEGKFYPNLDILKHLRIDLFKLRSLSLPSYKDAVCFINKNRFLYLSPKHLFAKLVYRYKSCV